MDRDLVLALVKDLDGDGLEVARLAIRRCYAPVEDDPNPDWEPPRARGTGRRRRGSGGTVRRRRPANPKPEHEGAGGRG